MTTNSSTDDEKYSLWARAAWVTGTIIALQVLFAKIPLQSESKRRWQHMITCHLLVQVTYFVPRWICRILLVVGVLLISLALQLAPQQFYQSFGSLMRPSELPDKNGHVQQYPGSLYVMIGILLTEICVQDIQIGRYAVECLAVCDPMASWIGQSIPSRKIAPGTSLAGVLACFGSAIILGYVMLDSTDTTSLRIWLGAAVCTVAEALDVINDNVSIPLATGLVVEYLSASST
jgi:dolichol kinase